MRDRAASFAARWRGETRENAEAQTFWNEWFAIFGLDRRRYVQFERHATRSSTGGRGRIDAFWPGQVAVEHKSAHRSLREAEDQALDYLNSLDDVDQPRLIITSDFARLRVLDLETGEASVEFPLDELPMHLPMFGFLAGYETRSFQPEDDVSIAAAEIMGGVYDQLNETGFAGHDLAVFLTRLMFLMFADDTGIWERGLFEDFLENRTALDGSDLGPQIEHLFRVLDTPDGRRSRNLDAALARFPYVNGGLFSDRLDIPSFDRVMREQVLAASRFDWSRVSPAIFGSLFQSVMDEDARRSLGAHYTTEQNIMKVVSSLFLDSLRADFDSARSNVRRLRDLHARLEHLTFFDPAAGSGNFLVIAYREIRRLEFDILVRLQELTNRGQQYVGIEMAGLSRVNVNQFYGIEIEEFPARIAETALYLIDHLENMRLSAEFGQYFARIPLEQSSHIHVGNACRMDWQDVLPAADCTYLLGNPPFIGKHLRTGEQTADLMHVLGPRGARNLDYVSAWYVKAINYIRNTATQCAFVSTNSIVQGEQVPALWPRLLDAGLTIDFAHRTFSWSSEARGAAHVHVIIIGFSHGGRPGRKRLYDYPTLTGQPVVLDATNINPYLVDAPTVIAKSRSQPLVAMQRASAGSKPTDDGNLLINDKEKRDTVLADPRAARYVREAVDARGLINSIPRWCLWLPEADPGDMHASPVLQERLALVRAFRARSAKPATRVRAASPGLFEDDKQPDRRYLCLPRHSSQTRSYIPMRFYDPTTIALDSTITVAGADDYLFGVLSSSMFMTWVRTIAGRIKSDYRLSADLVYNAFPWPEPTAPQKEAVRLAASHVLEARADYIESSLAVLYDPTSMPVGLRRAHTALDRTVVRLFRARGALTSELERQNVLFERYQLLAEPLLARAGRAK